MINQPTFIPILNSKNKSNINNNIFNNLHVLLFILVVILLLIIFNYKDIYNNKQKLSLYLTSNDNSLNNNENFTDNNENDLDDINVDSLEELREQINKGSVRCDNEFLKKLIMAPNLMQLRSGADMFNLEESKQKIKDDGNILTSMVKVDESEGPPSPPKVPNCTLI
jgi:hypothetical protein